jgi:4-amino-4-deoxy-L-arabinose transferase-like glycosyltransferase
LVELIFCTLIATVATGSGQVLLRKVGPVCRSRAEELAFSLGLGFGILALGILALGLLQLLYAGMLYGLLVLLGILGHKELVGLAGRLKSRVEIAAFNWRSFYFWVIALVGLGLLFNLARALEPAHGAVDPLAYHLALPKIYLQKHYLSFERTLTGALYPDNIGMLYALAIGLHGASMAQVLHWFMGTACLFFVWVFSRSYFDEKVGVWATAVFCFTPVLVFFAPLGYVDVGLCFFQFLGCWALFNWIESQDRRALLLSGVFTGLAMGSKHAGLFMWLCGLIAVAGASLYRREGLGLAGRRLLVFGGIALCLAAPWYGRALWEAGNPVWPVANHLFGGLPYKGSFSVGGAGATEVAMAPSLERIVNLLYLCASSLWEWAWNDQLGWQRATGIYFVAFLPGLLVYGRQRRVLLLAAFCLLYYLLMVLYIDGNPRYNLFLFAFMSVLVGFVAERMVQGRLWRWRPAAQAIFLATLLGNLGHSYALSWSAIDYVFSDKSPEQYLVENEDNYRAYRFINQNLPASAVVLLQGMVKGYYCDRPYLWDHPYQMLIQYREYKTAEQLLQRLKELKITHVVRMIYIPPLRTQGVGYPQYFADAFHEDFRKKYLKLIYRDERYVVFEVLYPF